MSLCQIVIESENEHMNRAERESKNEYEKSLQVIRSVCEYVNRAEREKEVSSGWKWLGQRFSPLMSEMS